MVSMLQRVNPDGAVHVTDKCLYVRGRKKGRATTVDGYCNIPYHCYPIMKLIVITPEVDVKDELQVVNSLLDNGLQRLHVRKPEFTTNLYKEYICQIAPEYHSRLVIHGGFELCRELELGGIHLNNAARNDAAILEQVHDIPAGAISTSFHSWKEIEDNKFPYSYVFISPVFDSISKSGYKAGIDLNGANQLKERLARQNTYCPKLVGLGGVGALEEVIALRDNGFDGAALLGGVWMAKDPVGSFLEMLKAL